MEQRQIQPVDYNIARQLKTIRQIRGLSLQDVAKKIGISYQQLQKYEDAKNRINAGRLWELSRVYHVPISDFYMNYDHDFKNLTNAII